MNMRDIINLFHIHKIYTENVIVFILIHNYKFIKFIKNNIKWSGGGKNKNNPKGTLQPTYTRIHIFYTKEK